MKKEKFKPKIYARTDGTSFHRKAIRIHGKKIERSFSRKVDADKWYAEMRREKELAENGLGAPTKDISVTEFAEQWLEKRKQQGKPLSSWEADDRRLRLYILPKFGSRSLQKISTKDWEQFFDELISEEEMSPATRNRVRSIVTKMYNDAIRLELASNNPARVIPKLRESMDAWSYWQSTDEILSYLERSREAAHGFWVFANLALNTGARIGELLALDWSDINLVQKRIHIAKVFEESSGKVFCRTKGHKARWLGINDALVDVLTIWKRETCNNSPSAPVICDKNGKRIYERKMRDIHHGVCKKAEVNRIRIHDLRHTYASHYVMNGGSLAELQCILGHSSPMMTLKYAHLAPGFLESRAKVVSFSVTNSKVVPLRKAE